MSGALRPLQTVTMAPGELVVAFMFYSSPVDILRPPRSAARYIVIFSLIFVKGGRVCYLYKDARTFNVEKYSKYYNYIKTLISLLRVVENTFPPKTKTQSINIGYMCGCT